MAETNDDATIPDGKLAGNQAAFITNLLEQVMLKKHLLRIYPRVLSTEPTGKRLIPHINMSTSTMEIQLEEHSSRSTSSCHMIRTRCP
jgi:hypothetical protein